MTNTRDESPQTRAQPTGTETIASYGTSPLPPGRMPVKLRAVFTAANVDTQPPAPQAPDRPVELDRS